MRRRRGFTLVELMVSLALIVFIMAIISEAFAMATKTFSDLKGAGDLAEKLRTTTAILRHWLSAQHCVTNSGVGPSSAQWNPSLSQPPFWWPTPTTAGPPYALPIQGYFRIYQGTGLGTAPNTLEGSDSTFTFPSTPPSPFPTYRVVNHALQFTVQLPFPGRSGFDRSDFFAGYLPNPCPATPPLAGIVDSRYQDAATGLYTSQWAEMAFFLRALIDPNTGAQETANGTKLWGLYMRQQLAVPVSASGPTSITGVTASDYVELSGALVPPNPAPTPPPAATPALYCNSPADLTEPVRRFGMDPTNANFLAGMLPAPLTTSDVVGYHTFKDDIATTAGNYGQFAGADLLLTNVVSFEVRVLLTGGADFVDLFDTAPSGTTAPAPTVQSYSSGNPAFYNLPGGSTLPMVFDTWSSNADSTFTTYNYSTSFPPGTPATAGTIPLFLGTNTKPINIQAVQITLRVWDDKTELTRQVTIIVPM
jgi:prepilin-type N-terminal cleavage/methylation domain-containing protein